MARFSVAWLLAVAAATSGCLHISATSESGTAGPGGFSSWMVDEAIEGVTGAFEQAAWLNPPEKYSPRGKMDAALSIVPPVLTTPQPYFVEAVLYEENATQSGKTIPRLGHIYAASSGRFATESGVAARQNGEDLFAPLVLSSDRPLQSRGSGSFGSRGGSEPEAVRYVLAVTFALPTEGVKEPPRVVFLMNATDGFGNLHVEPRRVWPPESAGIRTYRSGEFDGDSWEFHAGETGAAQTDSLRASVDAVDEHWVSWSFRKTGAGTASVRIDSGAGIEENRDWGDATQPGLWLWEASGCGPQTVGVDLSFMTSGRVSTVISFGRFPTGITWWGAILDNDWTPAIPCESNSRFY